MSEEDTAAAEAGKTSILKGWAAVIASIAALVTAISALLKPPQEPAAKAAYETLSQAVKENSEQTAKNHDDIQNLRNYLEGYMRGNGSHTPEPADAGSAAPVPATTSSGLRMVPRPPASMAPPVPPSVGPRPPVWEPPDFSQVKKR